MHPALLQCPADTREERLAGPKVPSLPLRPSSPTATNHAPTRSNPPLWHLAAQPAPLQAQQHDLRAPQPDPHTSTALTPGLSHPTRPAHRAPRAAAESKQAREGGEHSSHHPPAAARRPAGVHQRHGGVPGRLRRRHQGRRGDGAPPPRQHQEPVLVRARAGLRPVQSRRQRRRRGGDRRGKRGVWWRGGRSAAQAPPAFSSIHAGRPRVRSTSGPSGAARGGRMACRTRPPSSGPLKLAELPPPLNCGPKTPVFLLRSPLAFCRSTPAKHARARVQNLSRPARGAGRRGRTLGARAGPLQTSPTRR